MAEKNTVEVVIDGKIYRLSGSESDSYMHEVAGYLNNKISEFKKELRYYNKLDDSLKALLLEINICDDLFTEQEKSRKARIAKEEQEREAYTAKHDLVNMQMKLETTQQLLKETQRKLAEYELRERLSSDRKA